MLGDKHAAATVAVKDIAKAKSFYEGTLGLKLVHDEGGEALSFRTGNTNILVYRSQFAGTNKATAATWDLGTDVDRVVKALRDKGVAFEHYDMPGTKLEGDIHVAGKMRVAWFKDPDGNIHALTNG